MTCHIVISGSAGTLMMSDSQLSDSIAEFHGVEKQYCGPDFLVGGAGASLIIMALFEHLRSLSP